MEKEENEKMKALARYGKEFGGYDRRSETDMRSGRYYY